MLKTFIILGLLTGFTTFAQLRGTVKSDTNEPLQYVNIFIENSFTGTTSNNDGQYELQIESPGTYTIIFKYLGFKTERKTVTIPHFPFQLDMVLTEEDVSLDEVVVNTNENPAHQIIQNAIDKRAINLKKINAFKAHFYSRGFVKIKNVPEKFLGQEIGDLDGDLDSTRSGIIYLSETISDLYYKYPNILKEHITASKVSGDDNGFSFNTASDANFNFYNNTIDLGNQLISPIANNAFSYYNYKLKGVFYDNQGHLINKINVQPKRQNDNAFTGTIFIVEDQWTIYGLELSVSGEQAQLKAADTIKISQQFSFSKADNIWAKISQRIDFKYSFLGVSGNGHFIATYTDYNFNPTFTKNTFTKEVISFEKNANLKDSLFWQNNRPIKLTTEEATDYIKKDSIYTIRNSKPYLDSVDTAENKFKIVDILSGYTYQNSIKNYQLGIEWPITELQFNTVQGWNFNVNAFFRKELNEDKRYYRINTTFNYGFSDDRLRATTEFVYLFNNISKPFLSIRAGVKTEQFNESEPIKPLINSISSLFFKDNYMKLYDRQFLETSFSDELFNGLRYRANLSYQKRKALFNTTDYVIIKNKDNYSSNSPVNVNFPFTSGFNTHHILKFNLDTRIMFGQTYMSHPDGKFNIQNEAYPILYLGFEGGFSGSKSDYNFQQLKARLTQAVDVGSLGRLSYNLKGGLFFNSDAISFIDYEHFNGNQTHVNWLSNYTNTFFNLPYYALSTNDTYAEMHLNHNFKGFILNKIPFINQLNFNLIISANALYTNNNPYHEVGIGLDNIGWGKYRFLRIDYVRSYYNGITENAIVFGLHF